MIRTRVGYAGGTTENPSYRAIGDHIEAVEVVFDPGVISYGRLLQVFREGHDPGAVPRKRQYMSAIFPRGEGQKRLAVRSLEEMTARRGGKIFTKILPGATFHTAETYHQKFALRGKPDLLKEYETIYPDGKEFLESTAVARVNGYAGGYGTCDTLRREIGTLGLTPAGRRRLEEIACPHGAEREGTTGDACPAG